MNIYRFLLIDATLIGLILLFLFIFKSKINKYSSINDLKKNNVINKNFPDLPNQKTLLQLEKLSRKEGSQITLDSLIGLWRFQSVWKSGSNKEESITNTLLRVFSASLEISKNEIQDEPIDFAITNSIQFGILSMLFKGQGNLKGKQPLLPFFFEKIELKAGSRILFSRSLEIPEENRRPFFSLIAMEKNGQWLSARGRGGGLALWIKS